MSDTINPYQSPAAETQAVEPLISQGGLTEIMLKHLSGASPWLRFMGIIGFIGSGLMVLGGISSLGFIPLLSNLSDAALIPLGEPFNTIFRSMGPLMAVYALYFVGGGVLMFFPALFTYRFGAKIRSYLQTNSGQELELAFSNNKSLWKFNGILMIINLAAVPVFTIISVVIIVAAMALG